MQKDDQKRATKADINAIKSDLQRLEASTKADTGVIQSDMQIVKDDVRYLHRRMEKLDDDVDKVLSILGKMDERLTMPIQDHERHIRRIEQKTGLTAARK